MTNLCIKLRECNRLGLHRNIAGAGAVRAHCCLTCCRGVFFIAMFGSALFAGALRCKPSRRDVPRGSRWFGIGMFSTYSLCSAATAYDTLQKYGENGKEGKIFEI